jgi:hypothetical protein
MKLRCYCCGEPLGARVALVTYSEDADRVFVMLPDHAKRVDSAQIEIVQRAP